MSLSPHVCISQEASGLVAQLLAGRSWCMRPAHVAPASAPGVHTACLATGEIVTVLDGASLHGLAPLTGIAWRCPSGYLRAVLMQGAGDQAAWDQVDGRQWQAVADLHERLLGHV